MGEDARYECGNGCVLPEGHAGPCSRPTTDREAIYHKALDDLLVLFVRYEGYDYNTVDAALDALAQRPDLPVTVAFADKVRQPHNPTESASKPKP